MCNVTFGLADQTNFGVSFLRPGFLKKLVGVRFSQLQQYKMSNGNFQQKENR